MTAVVVWRGLTRAQALRAAWPKAKLRGRRAFKSFDYNPRTGRAVFT